MLLTHWTNAVSFALKRPSRKRSRRKHIGHTGAVVETLEDRTLLSALVVENTNDAGTGSLRQAILDANASPGADVITFELSSSDPNFIDADSSLPGGDTAPDVFVIELHSALPALSDSTGGTTVDGRSQTIFGGDTNPFGPEIVLDGNLAGFFEDGLTIESDNNRIFGFNIRRFDDGIVVSGDNNLIAGNFVGTDATATTRMGNRDDGIVILAGGSSNTIGGATLGAANVISGNIDDGVEVADIGTNLNVIVGNYIGTNATGMSPLSNSGSGIEIKPGAAMNRIGTDGDGIADADEGNVISANSQHGVVLHADLNVVAGNLIGTDVTGVAPLGNAGNGVYLVAGARSNRIGTDGDGVGDNFEGNVIAASGSFGVSIEDSDTSDNVIAGNYIGTDVTGTVAVGNAEGGVLIVNGPTNNVVGGTSPGMGNLISGNNIGVIIFGSDSTNNEVLGNLIGTDATGTVAVANTLAGVAIIDGASNNRVGGTTPGARNVISGNADGILIGPFLSATAPANNVVQGNFIGTDVTGTLDLGNTENGIVITGTNNIVGGTAAGAANIISANGIDGVLITGADSIGNEVLGNFLGTDVTGTLPLGNAGYGVHVLGASNNTIGGTAPEAANVISGNEGAGIRIGDGGATGNLVQGNRIGTDVNGTVGLGNATFGVIIQGPTDGNTIGGATPGAGNVISAHDIGVWIQGTDPAGNVVQGNLIGTDSSGTGPIGNGVGILIQDAPNNTIGETSNGAGNVISGNSTGVSITGTGSTGNRVLGNLIGTDVTGSVALGNTFEGVFINEAANNVIGGTANGAENVISGNGRAGVAMVGTGATGNQVLGNLIGTDVTGTLPLGNTLAGVGIVDGASGNAIGGTPPGSGNVISANGDGIFVGPFGTSIAPTTNLIQGNLIGTDVSGTLNVGNTRDGVRIWGATDTLVGDTAGAGNTIAFNAAAGVAILDFTYATGTNAAIRNSVRGNSIFANGGLGIDLNIDNVTPNDLGDADFGSNGLQNFPIIDSGVAGTTTRVTGTLNTLPGTTVVLDFFANNSVDPSDHGEGERFLGSVTVTTDADGDASFDTVLAGSSSAGEYITATATDQVGSTSEFSEAILPDGPPIADAGGPYVINEGETLFLDASGSFDPDGDPLTYSWDVDGDGAFGDATGVMPTLTAVELQALGINDETPSFTVTVRVDDGKGGVAQATTTLTVMATNDPPVVDLNGPDSTDIDFAASFTEGSGPVGIVDSDLTLTDVDGGIVATAISGTGDIFVADYYGTIVRIDPDAGLQTAVNSKAELVSARGMTIDPLTGNLFVADYSGQIVEVDPNTGTETVVVPSGEFFAFPWDIEIDADGTLFVSEPGGDGWVVQIDPDTGAQTVIASGGLVRGATGLAIEADGSILVVASNSSIPDTVSRIDANTGTQTLLSSGGYLATPEDLTVDAAGNIFVADRTSGVIQIDPISGAQTLISSGSGLFSVVIDADQNIFATNSDLDSLVKIDRISGAQTVITQGGLLDFPTGAAVDATFSRNVITSATVTITNSLDGTNESLAADTTGTNVSASYDSVTGVLSLTGNDTAESYQQVLRTVTYNNTSSNPNTTPRIIEFVANDGIDESAPPATTTLTVNNLVDLSGRVFVDRDNDGQFDGGTDMGLAGVTVELFNENDLLTSIASETTNSDGSYTFEANLLPGTYRIVASQPGGLLDGDETAGGLGGIVDNSHDGNTISGIVVAPGDPDAGGYSFAEIQPSRIQGLVWEDFNNDGEIDFGERAIENVNIIVTGTDDRGNSVNRSMTTDGEGMYEFLNLRPSDSDGYTIYEEQPIGFEDGTDAVGTVDGIPTGNNAVDDVFSDVTLLFPALNAINYNFGERPEAGGTVSAGQTANIGFWQNKNGQTLVKSLNGGPNATQLANWLAVTFPDMYGANAGSNNLSGMTNTEVADFYRSLFKMKAGDGWSKFDAKVFAVALSVYVTNSTLADTTAEEFGFVVTETGVGTSTFNVGDNGEAFGVADNSELTVLDLLLATDARTNDGLLFDVDDDDMIDSVEQLLRKMANEVFTGISEFGTI